MVGHQVLVLAIGVRIPVPQPRKNSFLISGEAEEVAFIFYKRGN